MPQPSDEQAPPQLLEPFTLQGVNVVELGPEDDPSLPGPVIMLQIHGVPPWHPPGAPPKVYLTQITPKLARQLGAGLVKAGERAEQPIVTASAADLLTATGAADRLAEAARAMRGPRG